MQRVDSQTSLVSASAHSQDMGPNGESQEISEPLPDPVPLRERAVQGASRDIKSPYLLRDDVGVLGILCGNWGGSSRRCQSHIDLDLRASPAAILLLQEAQPELVDTLRQQPQRGRQQA